MPDAVTKAYGLESLRFGKTYLIPKPLDPRVLLWVAPAVAKAAMDSGVARVHLDLERYREQLEARLGKSREMMRIMFNKAKAKPKRIVLAIEGEMQADTALVAETLNQTYAFNRLQKPANVLIFPNLEAGNIAYKLVQQLANAEVVGPILVGMRKPVHILQRGDEVKDIVNLAALAVVGAQALESQAA